jgi:hypothetical protein
MFRGQEVSSGAVRTRGTRASMAERGAGGAAMQVRAAALLTSAKKRESQKVGCTGPIMHATPPSLTTRYASQMPRWGSAGRGPQQVPRGGARQLRSPGGDGGRMTAQRGLQGGHTGQGPR